MNPSLNLYVAPLFSFLLLPSWVPSYPSLLLTNPNESFPYASGNFFGVMVGNRIIILLIFFFVSKRKQRNHNSTIDFSTTESQFKYYFFGGLKYTKRNHDFVVGFASTHNGITILLSVLYNKILILWGECFWIWIPHLQDFEKSQITLFILYHFGIDIS